MSQSTIVGGKVIGLVLVLSLLTANTASASGPTAGRIIIHKLVCSTQARNLFTECHGKRLTGADFTVFSPTDSKTKATDESGVVSFRVGQGARTIAEDPAAVTDGGAFVFCSTESRPGSGDVLGGVTTANGMVTIHVSFGHRVICDWYDLVRPGSLHVTIHLMDCPRNTADPLNTCHGRVPVRMPGRFVDLVLDAGAGVVVATTNAHGVATAQVATPRSGKAHLFIAEDAFAVPAAGAFVFCSSDGRPTSGDVLGGVITRDGSVQFDVARGTALTCDWYDRI